MARVIRNPHNVSPEDSQLILSLLALLSIRPDMPFLGVYKQMLAEQIGDDAWLNMRAPLSPLDPSEAQAVREAFAPLVQHLNPFNNHRRQIMTHPSTFSRRTLLAAAAALSTVALPSLAQTKTVLRISTPAVPDDWHAKMWTVFKDTLEKTAPGEFDVQINLNASLFKQGTEPAAMARGNLELSSISAFDIAKLVPEFSIFTAGYIMRDPDHQQKVFNGPIGAELFKTVSEKMDVTPLATVYLGTRQVNLREAAT